VCGNGAAGAHACAQAKKHNRSQAAVSRAVCGQALLENDILQDAFRTLDMRPL
jgi:hypothetical protein